MKKTILLQKILLAVMLSLAANIVVADTLATESFSSLAQIDEANTTINWSEADQTVSLVAGNRLLNDRNSHWVMTLIGGSSDNSTAAVMGDVNDDGELDLLVANKGAVNKVYLSDGNGGFFLGSNGGAIGEEMDASTSLALGDVDGDGDLDLFVGNAGLAEHDDLSNKLYLNDGGGKFSLKKRPVDSPTPDFDDTRALALADVDSDGDLDLVVANAGQANKLYLNDGDGNFAVVGTEIGGEVDMSTSLVLVDVDEDGDIDLVVGNAGDIAGEGKVNNIYVNDGSGVFSRSFEAFDSKNDADITYALAFGDVDNDGDVDLIAANNNQVNKLYLNRGAGKFDATGIAIGEEVDASSSAVLVDTDSDGDLDLVVANENQPNKLYLNKGAGQFSSVGIVLSDEADTSKTVCFADVDGDGDMDALIINQGQDHKLYRNGLGGGFVALGTDFGFDSEVTSVAIDDLNNDGLKDIVVGAYDKVNKVYLNDGSGGFSVTGFEIGVDPSQEGILADADATYSIALADMNGDKFLDVVVGNYGDVNKVYLNDADGSGRFSTAGMVIGVDDEAETYKGSTPLAYSATYSVALADVDGVNGPDIVFGNNSQPNKLYLNDGSGMFPASGINIGSETDFTYSVALADMNGDAMPDLIVANANQTNKLYLNDGAGVFDAVGISIGDETDSSISLAVADLDGVNGLDVIVGNNKLTSNKLYLNDGNGGFASAGIPIGDEADESVGIDLADIDGDGDSDLLVANKNGFNKLYLNDGMAGFSTAMAIGEEVADSRFIKRVDFNSDGFSEVLVGNYGRASKHLDSVVYRAHIGRVVSKTINPVDLNVRTVSLKINFLSPNKKINDVDSRNTWVDVFLSNDGGLKWHRAQIGAEFFFPSIGNDLRWRVELNSLSPVRTPVLDQVVIERVNTLPIYKTTPSIKGVFAVDETLELINYEASDPEGTNVVVTYQWLSGGNKIDGATTTKYVLAETDINAQITVEVSARDSEGGELTVVTEPVNKSSYDEFGTGENSDPNSADANADDSTDDEEANRVVKRTGGGSLNLFSMLGLGCLFMWRDLVARWLKWLVAPVFCRPY